MKIVITDSIRKREFKQGHIPDDDLQTIVQSYAKGIAQPIKGSALPKGSRLIKLYATTISGARRIVFLVDVQTQDAFFLLYRDKNDTLGKNMSARNPAFVKKISQYLDLLTDDMTRGAFSIYELR